MLDSTKKLLEMVRKWRNIPELAISPVGSGHYNEVYEFTDEDDRYILRVAPGEEVPKLFYEVNIMHSEPPIHQKVMKHTAIPIPEIVFYNFKRSNSERDYLIMRKMKGKEGGYDLKQLGKYIAQLHQIKGEGFGYPDRDFALGKSWPKTFFQYGERIFKDCLRAEAITPKEYDFFLDKYEKNIAAVEECEPSLLHLDLWYTNILTENGNISAILDFDRGMYGDVELEFAVLDTYASATPEFFTGYGHPRPGGYQAEKRRILYLVYELIKYAFIRLARNHNYQTARAHVAECLSLMRRI